MSGTRLRRAHCAEAGIRRRRNGRGFFYLDPRGRPLEDGRALERIRALAVPPAWREVWICAGRKQYLYHERWQRRAAERKFAQVREFAAELSRLRRAVARDLRRPGVPRERALACAVRLLDLGLLRIGGEEYAEANGSFGVATIRREHVSLSGDELRFDFPAKSGRRRARALRDRDARLAIEAMRRRRSGPDDLLVYREGGAWRDVRSADVNAYIQEIAGEGFSAKDFRTWHATVLAALGLAAEGPARSRTGADRTIRAVIGRVAEALGNTPSVCRASYVDPRVLDRYRDGVVIAAPARAPENGSIHPRRRARIEREVLKLVS